MVSVAKIGWGRYDKYEGPYFKGSISYVLPPNPTESDLRLRVITATEGGCYDAVNMYDKCIVSIGLIQWCEAQFFLTSRLLHHVVDACGSKLVLDALDPALEYCCAEFKPNANKQWRFFFKDGRGEVNTPEKQQQLFLGCDGKQGSWTPEAKIRAKLWASCFSEIWNSPHAQRTQVTYTGKRLVSFFVLPEGKQILWDNTPDSGWNGMLRAAFLSFAANNTKHANDQLQKAAKASTAPKWSPAWCINVLQHLTFGPNIAIYPERYEKIRPFLEELWQGVSLPKTAKELKTWKESEPVVSSQPIVEPIIIEPEILYPDSQPEIEQVPPAIVEVPTSIERVDSVPPNFKPGLLSLLLKILTLIATLFGKKAK